ncbi:VOC family protein [Paenibacillus sp. GYB003]|uniref:VOC family protein n=1 Tax=Paenibacillus sp. GYB003 TaxID=2994392 RepID=UPI002F9616DA
MQKIVPFLWFDNNAEEAIAFYSSIFKSARTVQANRRGDGTLMSATFELEGQTFMALNGGPHFQFNEAVSLFVNCETQEEVDDLWERLTADGGQESRCGWLKDKFGLSWQIVPTILGELLQDKDERKANNVMQAMLRMNKLDIEALKQAYAQ